MDSSILNAMRLRRRLIERQAEEKLRVLRRLRRRYETKSLPKEISAETSFIEQLFAKLFDYATLLSHDADTYELHAKPYVPGTGQTGGRFPDFSLGRYTPGGGKMLLASAELKGAEADLDAPQGAAYGGLSPVQQAFTAVNGRASCRWVIVSNLVELRLYRREDLPHEGAVPPAPVVIVDLRDIWDHKDLAQLCAHFDRAALLGTSTDSNGEPRSELMAALEQRHPATPLDAKPEHVRAVLLFAPRVEEDYPMFLIERRLRQAIAQSPGRSRFFGASGGGERFELVDGCIIALGDELPDGVRCKVAMSGEGQLQMSVSRKVDDGRVIPAGWLVDVARFFLETVDNVFEGLSEATPPGRVSPELREVDGVTLQVEPALAQPGIPTVGKAGSDVMGVDFLYTPVLSVRDTLVTDIVSELAIYFRSAYGGVGFDRDKLRSQQSS